MIEMLPAAGLDAGFQLSGYVESKRRTSSSYVAAGEPVQPGQCWLQAGHRRLTRDSQNRRLTRGSRVSVVSLVIPYSSPFFRKKNPEKVLKNIRKKSGKVVKKHPEKIRKKLL